MGRQDLFSLTRKWPTISQWVCSTVFTRDGFPYDLPHRHVGVWESDRTRYQDVRLPRPLLNDSPRRSLSTDVCVRGRVDQKICVHKGIRRPSWLLLRSVGTSASLTPARPITLPGGGRTNVVDGEGARRNRSESFTHHTYPCSLLCPTNPVWTKSRTNVWRSRGGGGP